MCLHLRVFLLASGQLLWRLLRASSHACACLDLLCRLLRVTLLRRRRRRWPLVLRLRRRLLLLLRVLHCSLPTPCHKQVSFHGLQVAPEEAVRGIEARRCRHGRPGRREHGAHGGTHRQCARSRRSGGCGAPAPMAAAAYAHACRRQDWSSAGSVAQFRCAWTDLTGKAAACRRSTPRGFGWSGTGCQTGGTCK